MKKLFAALREKHPDCEIVDVRFLIDSASADGKPAEEMDDAFAKAVRVAKQVDIQTVLA